MILSSNKNTTKKYCTLMVLIFLLSITFFAPFTAISVYAACVAPYSVESIDPSTGRVLCSAPANANTNAGNPGGNNNAPGTLLKFTDVLSRIINIINIIIPFLVSLAVFIIIYGIFGFISSAGNEESRKEAKDFILWGVIGVALMFSVWGLINILVNVFPLNSSSQVVFDRYGRATDAYGVPLTDNKLPNTPPQNIPELITRIYIIGSYLIPFLISIAVFILIIGIFNYVREADNEEKRADAKNFIMWGVIFITIMLSIWGLVNILLNTFNFDSKVPQLNGIFNSLKESLK